MYTLVITVFASQCMFALILFYYYYKNGPTYIDNVCTCGTLIELDLQIVFNLAMVLYMYPSSGTKCTCNSIISEFNGV